MRDERRNMEVCAHCKFFDEGEQSYDPGHPDARSCRRFPKHITPNGAYQFSPTHRNGWCGEWKWGADR